MTTATLRALLPACVEVSERRHDDDGEKLHPEEIAHISRAVAKRRQEFTTVRRCARDALARLGLDRPPMVPGPAGSPRWPAGTVGSMTHCSGYRAAVVARATDVRSVGIDAETNEELPPGVLSTVVSAAETERIRLLSTMRPDVAWDRLVFSAKESVYKTWYPLTGEWLGFEEADIVVDPSGSFRARLTRDLPLSDGRTTRDLPGRWTSDGRQVLTAIAIVEPRPPGS